MIALLSCNLWKVVAQQMKICCRLERWPFVKSSQALPLSPHNNTALLSSLRSTLLSCTCSSSAHVLFFFWCKVTICCNVFGIRRRESQSVEPLAQKKRKESQASTQLLFLFFFFAPFCVQQSEGHSRVTERWSSSSGLTRPAHGCVPRGSLTSIESQRW